MQLVSYNVNGIRAAVTKGFFEWIAANQFDILCLQEVKAEQNQVDLTELEKLGYHFAWHTGEKKGYSGVAIFSKKQPDRVVVGCGIEKYDREGRIIRADFGEYSVLNCYFPSGSSGDERQAFKMEFLEDFGNWFAELKKERPNIIVVGDYNIAHNEIDIHDPKGNKKSSGFLPEERAWMTEFLGENNGMTDAFRQANPTTVEYSWWTFRFNSRAKNKGWRIDYQSVTSEIAKKIKAARHFGEVIHSDHCAIWVDYDL
jgi:exodeoxyribonuclease III